MSSSFITVEKRHFEYLLEIAEAQSSKENTSLKADSVVVSNAEYNRLLQDSIHFNKLKDSLLDGGLSTENLDVLIYGSPTVPESHSNENVGQPKPIGFGRNITSSADSYHAHSNSEYHISTNFDEAEDEDALLDSQDSDEKDEYDVSSRTTGSSSGAADRRTVMIRNLPDKVTHKDIVDIMRGGALLHIYLRAREHTASVSYVEETDAQDFFQHAKTYGLHMAGKRVEVLWNDRQFYLPPFVRAKINNGASRNLVIYNVKPNITEWHIRKDLDHIHNLIVVAVKFNNGNAYISTNSVHNALFARSCMMSRLTYKGMKIGFYPDECTGPFIKPLPAPKKDLQTPSKNPASVPNRFQLLSLDGTEEDDNDEHGHDGLSTRYLSDGIHWADNSIPA